MQSRHAQRPALGHPIVIQCSALLLGGALLGLTACGGKNGAPQGADGNGDHCTTRASHENNCLACSAERECAWCSSPHSGNARCQPLGDSSIPKTCEGEWSPTTDHCTTPPPPPPGGQSAAINRGK